MEGLIIIIIIKINELPKTAADLKLRTSRAWKANIKNLINEDSLIVVHQGVILEEYSINSVKPDAIEANRVCFDLSEVKDSKLKGLLIKYRTSNPCTTIDIEELGGIVMVNDTRYCTVHAEGELNLETYRPVIQRIRIKQTNEEEIRFAYYNINEEGKEHFQPRPLDLKEDDMISLIEQGMKKGVFSEEGLIRLQKIFNGKSVNAI